MINSGNIRNRYILLLMIFIIGNISMKGENKPYLNPTPGNISIMAVNPFPDGIRPSEKGYQEIVDCGFNLVTAVGSVDYFQQQFKLMGDLDLKYLISNQDLRSDKRNLFINAFKNNKHLGGWLFKDEPNFQSLSELQKQYNALYKADSSTFIYMNLVGKLQKNSTGSYSSYYDYLNHIQSLFQPSVWSSDFYPVYLKYGKITVFYDQFFTNLEAMNAISKKTNRPFWSFCLSMPFKIGTLEYPAATEAYLRFEAFSALAYGAQGIVYWCYGQRESNSVETYLSALVNLNGKKSSAWFAAQKVNNEIKKYNNIFFNCRVEDVRHTGDKIYKGTKKLSGSFGPFKMIRSGDEGVLVSSIKSKDAKYIVIVNHSVTKSQTITLELNANNNVIDITSVTQNKYSWRNQIKLKIDKGSYLIFKVVD